MKKLYEGKTKDVMLDEETGIVHLFFKDSATGENGVFDGEDWTVLTGVSLENLTQAEFFIGGNKLTFDDNGVYTGENFQLKLEENKLTMLGISKN